MAKKGGSKGVLSYDYHNLTPDQKQKVNAVHDQFPEVHKDMVAIVLDNYDFDEDKAIGALTTDGGKSACTSWRNQAENSQCKVNKKKKNKKKNKKDGSQVGNSTSVLCNDADDSSSLHSSNIDFDPEKDAISKIEDHDDSGRKREKGNFNVSYMRTVDFPSEPDVTGSKPSETSLTYTIPPLEEEQSCKSEKCILMSASVTKQELIDLEGNEGSVEGTDVVIDTTPQEKNDDSRHQKHRQRHTSSQYCKSPSVLSDDAQVNLLNTPKKGGLIKCKKDLNRQTISLQRIEIQLNNKLEEASKCLKNTFAEVRKMLDKRQSDLEEELNKVKIEASSLLKSRQNLAAELKLKVDRAMNDSDWNELRADIKQFVTERKYDDELGKTIWYRWCMDAITEMQYACCTPQIPVTHHVTFACHTLPMHICLVTAAQAMLSSCAAEKQFIGKKSEALQKFWTQRSLRTGKDPLAPVVLKKLVKHFEETGTLEDCARTGRPCLHSTQSHSGPVASKIKALATEAASGTSSAHEAARQLGLPASTAICELGEVCPVKNYYSQRHSSQVSKSPEPITEVSEATLKAKPWTSDGTGGHEVSVDSANTSNAAHEGKSKDVQTRNSGQGSVQGCRVFCSTRYSHGNRYPANHRGFYRSNGRSNYSRGRHYENWQYGGADRRNDYKKPYQHDRSDHSQLPTNTHNSGNSEVHESEQGSSASTLYPRETTHVLFRGYERKPYSTYRQPRPHYTKPHGAGRVQRVGLGTVAGERAADKNSIEEQGKQDIVNGF